ncbi:MAG: hypothetical protein IJS68_04115 [Clostridia bacterium]|nr:hypothetical protein [Clostridia bacterium]
MKILEDGTKQYVLFKEIACDEDGHQDEHGECSQQVVFLMNFKDNVCTYVSITQTIVDVNNARNLFYMQNEMILEYENIHIDYSEYIK